MDMLFWGLGVVLTISGGGDDLEHRGKQKRAGPKNVSWSFIEQLSFWEGEKTRSE